MSILLLKHGNITNYFFRVDDDDVVQINICGKEGRFGIGENKRFDHIEDLIAHYREDKMVDNSSGKMIRLHQVLYMYNFQGM